MNAHHLLADLESRLTELQDLSNDAYDIAAGTLMPGITDLAPPATPQQEVFGGVVEGDVVDDITNVTELAPPASWTVREIEEEVEQPVLDDEGNPVLNEDGTPKTETVKQKSWKVWSPLWQVGRTLVRPKSAIVESQWVPLGFNSGEIYAILKVEAAYSANGYDFTNPTYELTWINEDPSALTEYQDSDGMHYHWVKIGVFQGVTGGNTSFAQFHTGVIVEDVTSGPSAPGTPGEPGKDGAPGEDGATWTPSLRTVTVTTPNSDNSGSTSHEEVYLDFTNSKTGEVIEGTVNIKGKDGKDGEPGESSSGGSGNLPDAQEISFIASIEFKDGKLLATKGTLKVYAAEDVVLDKEPVTLFETTPHSTQHTATSGGSGSEA